VVAAAIVASLAAAAQREASQPSAATSPRPQQGRPARLSVGQPGELLFEFVRALRYLRTDGETHVYRCQRHGELILPPDGRIRQRQS